MEEFKKAANMLFKKIIFATKLVRFKREYLYRAITLDEWQKIKEKGMYLIRVGVNFEETIGPQVQMYSKDKDYAGIIIRIPVVGPYFSEQGTNPKRVTSFSPHYVKPEIVLSGDEENIVSLLKYLEQEKGDLGDISNIDKKGSSSSINSPGGIAFNALPIQVQPIAVGTVPLAGARIDMAGTVPNIDLDTEWARIEQIFNAGIRPSIDRLNRYSLAASASPLAEEKIDQVRGMLADILRREEEDEKLTPSDPALKNLVATLEK